MGEMNDGNVSEMSLLEFHEYCKSVNVSKMDAHEFAMYCKRWNERWNNPQTEAERLVYEIAGNKKRKTNQEWLDLQEKVREFLKTAAEEDRKLIGGLYRTVKYDLQRHKGRSALRDCEYVKRRIE